MIIKPHPLDHRIVQNGNQDCCLCTSKLTFLFINNYYYYSLKYFNSLWCIDKNYKQVILRASLEKNLQSCSIHFSKYCLYLCYQVRQKDQICLNQAILRRASYILYFSYEFLHILRFITFAYLLSKLRGRANVCA